MSKDFSRLQKMDGVTILADWHTHADASYSISKYDVIGVNSAAALNRVGHNYSGGYYSTPKGKVYAWPHGTSGAREANRVKRLVGEVPYR